MNIAEENNMRGRDNPAPEFDHEILKSVFRQTPAAIAVVRGPRHQFVFSNPQYEKLFNRNGGQLLGRTLSEVFPELAGQGVFELFEEVYRTGEAFVAEEYPVSLDRDREGETRERYYNFVAQPLRTEAGEVSDIMIHAVEVTEQVLAKRKLEESEQQYRELIYSSPSMTALYRGEEMIIEVVNDAMLEAWDKDRDVVGKSLFSVLPEIREQGFLEMVRKVFETGEPHRSYELPVSLLRDGQMVEGYYNFIFHPRKDENGQVIGIIHTAYEVTPEAEMNRRTRESEAHYRKMADLLPAKITNHDMNGVPFYFNQAWRDFTGLSNDQMMQREWQEALHPDDLPLLTEKWQHSIETGEDYELEYRVKDREGNYRWHLVRGLPVKDEAGKVRMWITSSTDIQRLKEEDTRKKDFLRMVSHELKTPMTSIKGYVQVLQTLASREKNLPPSLPLKTSLDRIDSQVDRLTRLISEILDMSRIEHGRLELHKESFDLNTLVDETVQDILHSNPRQKIEVTHRLPCSVKADKERIGQVLINFITNAIKYSSGNREVKVEVAEGREGQAEVSVKDEGIGIPEMDLEKIFERFYRTRRHTVDTYSGFGIGLYLSKEIINRHGGEIRVESELGEGSEFTFSIPCMDEE